MRTRLIRSSSYPVPSSLSGHRTVLLHEALDSLDIQQQDIVVDATLGGAGHARAIAQKLDARGTLIGFDLDADAIDRAQQALADAKPEVILINANFRNMQHELQEKKIEQADKILFDLGWSAYQLDAGRGFSFLTDEPLVMSYAKEGNAFTAADIVNEWEETSIADVIFGWGEERYSRRIAKAIVQQREKKPIATARELAEIIRSAVPAQYRNGRLHPATKTFQALRIAVNDELGALKEGLQGAWQVLAPGGKIAVITFHSLEDRLVKQLFLELEREHGGTRITRSPIKLSAEEIKENPRARSAKLRVIARLSASHP